MKVYSISGAAADDSPTGEVFYRTLAEALTAAREFTAPHTHEGGSEVPGSQATVIRHVIGPLTHDLVVAMLNHEGWCSDSTTVAEVENGVTRRVEEKT
jgi:hypothetical protein